MRLSVKLFGQAVRKAVCKADDADEADHADDADDADEDEQGKEAVGEAVCEAVWWSLWWSRLVRVSAKLFGEAVRKAVCMADDANEANDADQV